MARLYAAPPPLLTIVGADNSPDVIQAEIYSSLAGNVNMTNLSHSTSSSTTSVVTVIIIIASAIIVSALLYLLIRCLSRRFNRSFRTFSAADDVVIDNHNNRCLESSHPNDDILGSLPLFTFSSLSGRKIADGDCAVCLSKFEPPDQLRLLPLCCHAFHSGCIDTWLASNQTCPLCRSTVHPTEADVLSKILTASAPPSSDAGNGTGNSSFRIEIGSISRRRAPSDSGRRSYSIGSFEYIVDDGYEVSVGSTHQRGVSDCTSVDKDSVTIPVNLQPEQPGESLASEVAGGRSWLREYIDRLGSVSLSSRSLSFRSSGRFFTGSSRRSDTVVVATEDLEANNNRIGEEISELFRWLSGV